MALTTLSIRWMPKLFWNTVATQDPVKTLANSSRWLPKIYWRLAYLPSFSNRVYDTVAGKHISWITLFPDTTGVRYPGPGVFGTNTSDYCITKIIPPSG